MQGEEKSNALSLSRFTTYYNIIDYNESGVNIFWNYS